MSEPPDPHEALGALAERAAALEDDLFAALAVLGEPGTQRLLDTWVDTAVDALRAVVDASVVARLTLAEPRPRAYRGQPLHAADDLDGRLHGRSRR